ncbi:SPOR domain-containing protein [Haliovirga abyssi]|uniref:SPOR domain-containing protein n=1 Tax=Haliovirga abyssi TaxID=2996794 RepID=A0AAU9E2G5_9FUSO|nr:hypothetical protein [Haliovirga abyssi]BDU50580.1 hypothetical protein HLVA_11490 [Haliovirga abyssi]
MRKFFVLGIGVGFILAGIFFSFFGNNTGKSKIIETKLESRKQQKEVLKEPVYFVQLGVYKHYESCMNLIEKIPEIKLRVIFENGLYKVITPKYKEYSKAEAVAEEIKNKYKIDVYIKKKQSI